MRRGVAWAVGLAVLALAACGGPTTVPGAGDAPAPPSRPDDGLLDDARLQELVDLQVERNGSALVGFLDAPDPAVRARAAFALGSVQDESAVPALLESLDDPEPRVRADVAFALGRSAGPDAADDLLDALDGEPDPGVRVLLLEALAEVGEGEALERLVSAGLPEADVQHPGAPAYARALARFGMRGHASPAAARWLAEALRAPAAPVRAEAARFFARTPPAEAWPDRVDDVREALDVAAPDDPAAMHLLAGLGAVGAEQDVERLLRWLTDADDWRIRTNAVRAVADRRGRDDVVAALLTALDDPSTHVARAAAEGLVPVLRSAPGRLDGIGEWLERSPERAGAAAPLLEVLAYAGRTGDLLRWTEGWGASDPAAGSRVLHALARAPGSRADSILLAAARGGGSPATDGALRALLRRWPLARADSSLHARYYAAFSSALRSDGVAARTVAPVLGDDAFRRFGSVARLLERFRALGPDGDPYARAAVLQGIARAAPDRERVEPLLRRALDDPHPAVRDAAREARAALPDGSAEPPPRPEGPAAQGAPAVDWDVLAELGSRPRLVLDTEEGRIVLVLDAEEAPLTVQTVGELARRGRYDGMPFHRVIPNFVAQTGDFVRGDGLGRPGFTLRTELTRIPFRRGVAGMASAGKDTEGSQFFVAHSPQLHLDGSYTAFGWLVRGADVLDRIEEGDRVLSVRVEPGEALAGASPGR